jgi:hypothetical protein
MIVRTTNALSTLSGALITVSGLLNPSAAWAALTPEQQAAVGAAAITHFLGTLGAQAGMGRHGWLAAELEGAELLEDLLRQHLPLAFEHDGPNGTGIGLPIRPDLSAIGIAQCTVCGCTDRCPCDDGWTWVTADLCSSCAPAIGVHHVRLADDEHDHEEEDGHQQPPQANWQQHSPLSQEDRPHA